MLIPLDRVFENGHNVRRVKASDQAEAQLRDSIAAIGVLEPVLLRPEGDRYIIIAGHRRVNACRALGLEQIPAELRDMEGADATAAQTAENTVRAPMHPVDQWRAVVQLQAEGYSLDAAASCLGFGERHARKLDKLGHLHPAILALIEEHGLPHERDLAVIANAPQKAQAAAAKRMDDYSWYRVADACKTKRVSRSVALFDTSLMAWDEDLFAEPGSADQFTTTDGEKFVKLQIAALDTLAEEMRAKHISVQVIEADKYGNIQPPTGWERSSAGTLEKPKKHETVFMGLDRDGRLRQFLAVNLKVEKARAKEKEARASAKAGANAGDDSQAAAPEPVTLRPVISKAGMAHIAQTKTRALREHMAASAGHSLSAHEMLRLMVLLLSARNVQLPYAVKAEIEELSAPLLTPGGGVAPIGTSDLCAIAGQAIGAILYFGGADASYSSPPSGEAAEWIAYSIGANSALPRFDTEEFLAHVSGAELRRLATETGLISPAASVAALRQKLAGNLEQWQPAVFGAPAPRIRERDPKARMDGEEAA